MKLDLRECNNKSGHIYNICIVLTLLLNCADMRSYIALIWLSFGLLSCQTHDNYHQGILDDLQGNYTIDSVVYIISEGQDSVLTQVGTFHFSTCDAADNFSSETCRGHYEVNNKPAKFDFQLLDDERLTLTPDSEDLPAPLGIHIGSAYFAQSDRQLILTFFRADQYELYLEDGEPQRIILTKQ